MHNRRLFQKGGEDDFLQTKCAAHKNGANRDTWENAILIYTPILDQNGVVRGVCGIEISDLYFRLAYPAVEGPYGKAVALICPADKGGLSTERAMLGGGAPFSTEDGQITLRKRADCYAYTIGNAAYMGLHQTLPFKGYNGENMMLLTLISADAFQGMRARWRAVWFVGLLLLLGAMLAISYFLAGRFSSPISEYITAVQQNEMEEGQRSGIAEIDQLVEYIHAKQQRHTTQSVLPHDIQQMVQRFVEKMETLTVTERIVFGLYAKGLDTGEVAKECFISESTARKHLNKIYKKMEISSRGELLLYTEILKSCGQMIEPKNEDS